MLCERERIVANLTNFRWEVAPPADADGVQQPFRQLDSDTVFTSTKQMVLDSIYVCPRCLVRCAAQPSDGSRAVGSWFRSHPVRIGSQNGICHSHNETFGLLKAESFIANVDYVDMRDSIHGNYMKISIEIPHRDGMLPVISTRDIVNLKFALSKSSYRHQHACSNLLDYDEHDGLTTFGFISAVPHGQEPRGPGYDLPHQFDTELRGANTIRLYQHLNIRSCLWTFEGYYHLSELNDVCGGHVTTDFAIADEDSSMLTVTVPLHVSYVYYRPPIGWTQFGHSTEMSFSFTYSTSLWRGGVGAEGDQKGRLLVLQAAIRPSDGRFVITFTTEAKFRGQFVLRHQSDDSVESYVDPPTSVAVDFELVEVFHENSFDSPTQVWQASSTLSARDYTGTYSVYLIPCTVKSTDSYEEMKRQNIHCTPNDPVKFTMPIVFSQVGIHFAAESCIFIWLRLFQVIPPVPEKYKLNTVFQLHSSLGVFLSNPFKPDLNLHELDYNGAFSKGNTIYGRVMWDPAQDLRRAFGLRIESVYLCSGRDGFVPYYDPEGRIFKGEPQYGCLRDHVRLAYSFKLIDRNHPDTEDKEFQGVQFQAQLASNSPTYRPLLDIPGVDGFSLLTNPLYKVEAGRQWFLQVVYSVSGAQNGITKRHVDTLAVVPLKRRSTNPTVPPGFDNGTDIRFFETENVDAELKSGSLTGASVGMVAGAAAGGMVAFLAIVFAAVGLIYVRHRRQLRHNHNRESKQEEPPTGSKRAKETDRTDGNTADAEKEYDEYSEDDAKNRDSDDYDCEYDDNPSIGGCDRTSAHDYSDNEHTEV